VISAGVRSRAGLAGRAGVDHAVAQSRSASTDRWRNALIILDTRLKLFAQPRLRRGTLVDGTVVGDSR